MKNLFLHLYIHQPANIEERIFREVVENLYVPVFRTIKNSKNLVVSISITLSVLEQLDKYNYKNLLQEIKDLVSQEKIVLVSCPAYNTRVDLSSPDFLINQIIMNEYALGYYFGMRTGFEGESAILIKDISTCFYSGNDLSVDLLKELSALGYSSVLLNSGFYNISQDSLAKDKINALSIKPEIEKLIYANMLDNTFDIQKLFPSLGSNNMISLPIDLLFSSNHDFSYRLTKLADLVLEEQLEFKTFDKLEEGISEFLEDRLSQDSIINVNNSKSMSLDSNKLETNAEDIKELLLSLAANFDPKHDFSSLEDTQNSKENLPFWQDTYCQKDLHLYLSVLTNRYSDFSIWITSSDNKKVNLGPLISVLKEIGNPDLLTKIEKLSG